MDLDSYIARYTGENRLRRLISIAAAGSHQQKKHKIDLAQRKQALALAERQMRRDGNASLYREIFGGSEDGAGRRIAAHDPKVFEGKSNERKRNQTQNRTRGPRRVLVFHSFRLAQLAVRDASCLVCHRRFGGEDNPWVILTRP